MTPADINIVKQWIAEGANFEGGGSAPVATTPPAVAHATPPGGAAPAAAAGGSQTWTSADGRTITATKLRLEGDNVVLQRSDGMCFLVPLSKLNAESQAQAKK